MEVKTIKKFKLLKRLFFRTPQRKIKFQTKDYMLNNEKSINARNNSKTYA